nr:MAG TPA: hypothetical protein [Caudoviricetes sp.]
MEISSLFVIAQCSKVHSVCRNFRRTGLTL